MSDTFLNQSSSESETELLETSTNTIVTISELESEDSFSILETETEIIRRKKINGEKSSDRLIGTKGKDTINGGAGNDTLIGGGNADVLNGGKGNDTYRLNAKNSGGSKIIDTGGKDTLKLNGAQLSRGGLTQGKVGFERDGSDLIIDLNKNGKFEQGKDLVVENFFAALGRKQGSGFIEQVDNLSGEVILKESGVVKVGNNKNNQLEGTNQDDVLDGKKVMTV
ncbi:hypothetical protein [Okeania sp. KiyG1]|uniref:calcium-binding protein n=1 Tax=Okeania sp. KiyG1 TaxID=2720165 RepID=UPI0019C1750C|nr:hypothetical protein [Okeania sp. KiyG1]GGA04638.1 hypothetical protein CYANOKiyG1_16950 [Okeania sp. KiyG1]